MNQINFTKEHLGQLQQLLTAMLFSNSKVKGIAGTELNAHQLLHDTSVKSLQTLLLNTSKEIENQSKLDRWSLTDYQQAKLKDLKEQAEMLDLLIGYKKSEAVKEANADKLKQMKATVQQLIDEKKTPDERIKELQAEIANLEG